MSNDLPGYRWSVPARNYRNSATSRPVRRQDILDLLHDILATVESRLGCYATAFYEGRLDPSYFAVAAERELTNLHIQTRALGVGGFENLTRADIANLELRLRDDLNRFLSLLAGLAVVGATLSLAQLLSRMRMYVGSARIEFWEAERTVALPSTPSMVLIERRVLTPAEHCPGCLTLYERGWCIQGELPLPGDGSTECMANDRCILMSTEVPYNEIEEWTGTKR